LTLLLLQRGVQKTSNDRVVVEWNLAPLSKNGTVVEVAAAVCSAQVREAVNN